ncbi:AAA family ATPase [Candidatus Micrarchaeota archaeon]|nr:AAA family ATPase [Candidatus Micrarchaeota archaeon]
MEGKAILPDKINGLNKRGEIYVSSPEAIKNTLESYKVDSADLRGKYKDIGGQKTTLIASHKMQHPVLMVGPTGTAKSLLVQTYSAEKELPLLWVSMNEDMTDAKLRGHKTIATIPYQLNGRVDALEITAFSPAPVALAALSSEPVIVYLDELHKMREGISSLLHSITNERIVSFPEFGGEQIRIHPETLVVAALNPNYGAGIMAIDPALRRRFVHLLFDYPNSAEIVKEIVMGDLEARNELDNSNKGEIEKIVGQLSKVVHDLILAFKHKDDKHLSADVTKIYSEIQRDRIEAMIEAPSPSLVTAAVELYLAGLPLKDAVDQALICPIVDDFGSVRKGLTTYVSNKVTI